MKENYVNLGNNDNRCYINTALQIFYYNIIKAPSNIKEFIEPSSFYYKVFEELGSSKQLLDTSKILEQINHKKGDFGDPTHVLSQILAKGEIIKGVTMYQQHILEKKRKLFEIFSLKTDTWFLSSSPPKGKQKIFRGKKVTSNESFINVIYEKAIKLENNLQKYIEIEYEFIDEVVNEGSFADEDIDSYEKISEHNEVEHIKGVKNGKRYNSESKKFLFPDYMFINLNGLRKDVRIQDGQPVDIRRDYNYEIPSILTKDETQYILCGYCVNLSEVHWTYVQCDDNGNESLIYDDQDGNKGLKPTKFNEKIKNYRNYRNLNASVLLYIKKTQQIPPHVPVKTPQPATAPPVQTPPPKIRPSIQESNEKIPICSYKIDGLRKRKSIRKSSGKRKSRRKSSGKRKRKSTRKRKSVR